MKKYIDKIKAFKTIKRHETIYYIHIHECMIYTYIIYTYFRESKENKQFTIIVAD